MAAHSSQNGGDGGVSLPDVVPLELAHLTRLSWELGARVVQDDESVLHSKWAHLTRSWVLSVFQVTGNTVLLHVRTPVGRERFYGATLSEMESARAQLRDASTWQRRN